MLRIVAPFLALSFLAAPALAQNEGKWGAIAYGAPRPLAGTAVNFMSADEARQAALESCGGQCTRSVVFLRDCAAVAEGAGGAGWANNRWRGRAMARALSRCRATGSNCTITAVACTAH